MQSLPDEVTLKIIKCLSLPSLCSLASICRRYRLLCSDNQVWTNLFNQEGLPILDKGYNFIFWLVLYRKALVSKKVTRDLLASYKEQEDCPFLIDPVPFSLPIYDVVATGKAVMMADPLRKDILEQGVEKGLYLVLSKKGKEFYYFLVTFDTDLNKSLEENQKILVERTIEESIMFDIIYRLSYYGLYVTIANLSPTPIRLF
ncbi:F-box domain-containing protein [Cedratvirus Zaza IHUMI]|uniref:F-box domain-containing protein n=1 Tax=Cedratvirus Zaza IHUMI TaxID=2126979 RepID=A0A2R8FFS3_9VIRU|nr:F-box domain-containing protein [Cedratvirus Zaza IHUMI]